MKKRKRRTKSWAPAPSHTKLKRFFFRCAISAVALAIVFLINIIAPTATKPLSEALYKSTDFSALKSGIIEYVKKYSEPSYEASSVK